MCRILCENKFVLKQRIADKKILIVALEWEGRARTDDPYFVNEPTGSAKQSDNNLATGTTKFKIRVSSRATHHGSLPHIMRSENLIEGCADSSNTINIACGFPFDAD